ncbi:MAG TPA: MOSC domain-containing protein [Vicinamibacterales bacterium]|nr:MOSC domain-containing protein [Vicinamibacterales bacterium]
MTQCWLTMSLSGRIESINTSRGGVPKQPVFEAFVTIEGIDGDRQHDRRFHGGPDRAVVIYSLEVIKALQAEGHPIAVGTAGENLTLSGVEWVAVAPGVELTIGEVRLVITKYASPCYKIAGSFAGGDSMRIAQKTHPGWSRVCARVLQEGLIRVGDACQLQATAEASPVDS